MVSCTTSSIDERSKQLLVREVGEIYQAFDQGHASSLPELSDQYADYAHWHRDTGCVTSYLRNELTIGANMR